MSSSDNTYIPPSSHCLHAGYSHALLKSWNSDNVTITAADLLYPIFILDENEQKQEIGAMPQQYRWSVDRLSELLDDLVSQGLRSVLLFGVLSDNNKKDSQASYCTSPSSPVPRAIKYIREKYPSLLIVVDICLCAYTDHGHCGIVREDGTINNIPSIHRIAEMAAYYGEIGAHVVAPSDMMDGRIGAIKAKLREKGLEGKISVMSYAAKFASCFYGPFRDAASSGMKFGDRSCYQLPAGSRGLALRAVERDVAEGADMVMVKPGMPYLDLVRDIKNTYNLPIAIYHVSGEYAMLYHAAKAGAFNLTDAVLEALIGMKRAGCTILITYFTPLILQHLNKNKST